MDILKCNANKVTIIKNPFTNLGKNDLDGFKNWVRRFDNTILFKVAICLFFALTKIKKRQTTTNVFI